jgi:general secretion pathway protein A
MTFRLTAPSFDSGRAKPFIPKLKRLASAQNPRTPSNSITKSRKLAHSAAPVTPKLPPPRLTPTFGRKSALLLASLLFQPEKMYNQFFALRENPFNVTPDPRFLFLNSHTQQALDTLTHGIQSRKGLLLLTGEVGTGKTTLLHHLLHWLQQHRTPAAFIFNSHLEVSHLFDFVLRDFAIKFDTAAPKDNLPLRLQQWLLENFRAGHTPVLIVDEAQGLADRVLEEIRLLLNMETCSEKLLQIVLAGQPQLDDRLQQLALTQLKQRIALRCQTAPLSRHETHQYIETRLHIAGANGQPIFASQSMDAAYFYSRGIPRVVNLLCEHALVNASLEQIQPVPPHFVAEVAREFQFGPIKARASSSFSAASPAKHSPGISAHSRFVNALSSLTGVPLPSGMPQPVVQRWAAPPDNVFSPLPQPAAPQRTHSSPKFFAGWTKFFTEVSSKPNEDSKIELSQQPASAPSQQPAIELWQQPASDPTPERTIELKQQLAPPPAPPSTAADSQVPNASAPSQPADAPPAAKSANHSSRAITSTAQPLHLLRWATKWTNSFAAAASTTVSAPPPANLLQLPTQLWLTASTWLRQPCDPTQWRLPAVPPFEALLRINHKKM